MTVQELIEKLSQLDGEATVHFAHGAGDYWRTEVAPQVTQVEEGFVKYSEYHNKPVVDNDVDLDDDIEVEPVVILR